MARGNLKAARQPFQIAPEFELRAAPREPTLSDALSFGGAARPVTRTQWMVWSAVALSVAAGLVFAWAATWTVLHHLFFVAFAFAASLRLAAMALGRRPATPRMPLDHELPAYTVIAPLYREAGVVAELIEALERIDYPRDRLQVLVTLEADDDETRTAFEAARPPPFIQMLVAPPGHPRTKPRACNVALEHASGELIVIYDAEDRPDPMQLREAAARFAAGEARLACLQAPLRIEPDRRFLPAQFALEYAAQFEVLQPALARFAFPFPLGGTSNHFRTDILRAVGGWDAFNVTEDADLGFRLARGGYSLGVLNAPTWETAPENLSEWLPQRTRWVKGYMQTFGVHTRGPNLLRPPSFAALLATLGVSIASAVTHGPLMLWVAACVIASLAGGVWPSMGVADLSLMILGWVAAVGAGALGLRRAGTPVRARDLMLAAFYWPLQSWAAARAIVQLFRRPYHWDKTHHSPRAGRRAA